MKYDLDSLEFWEKVLSEYNDRVNVSETFGLCTRSNLFSGQYIVHRDTLKILANKFLEQTSYKDVSVSVFSKYDTLNHYLFRIKKLERQSTSIHSDDWFCYARKIRLDFINWNINRLSNNL